MQKVLLLHPFMSFFIIKYNTNGHKEVITYV